MRNPEHGKEYRPDSKPPRRQRLTLHPNERARLAAVPGYVADRQRRHMQPGLGLPLTTPTEPKLAARWQFRIELTLRAFNGLSGSDGDVLKQCGQILLSYPYGTRPPS